MVAPVAAESISDKFSGARSGLLVLGLATVYGVTNGLLAFAFHSAEELLVGLSAQEGLFSCVASGISGQVVIPLMWAGFSRKTLLWRLIVFNLAVSMILLPWFYGDGDALASFQLWLPVVIAAFLPLAIYRFVGRWELIHTDGRTVGDSRQISIADLATITFVVALIIATQLHYRASVDWDQMFAGLALVIMWIVAAAAFIITTISLSFLFLLMRSPSRQRVGISCGIVIVSMAVAYVVALLGEAPPLRALGFLAGFSFPLLLIIIVSLQCIRIGGYRLEKHPRKRCERNAAAA